MLKWIGGLVPISLVALAAAASAQTAPYSVNDFVLGGQAPFDSAAYRDYRCGPSEQFDGFTWCQKTRQGGERRGAFRVTQSMLHSRDGKIAYINRQQDPVFFDGNDAEEDMRSFSRKIGSQPRVTKLPRRSGGPEGILALWGQVAIEPLDADSIKVLADGKSPRKGFLVDYVGNLTRSAQEGWPVYRITGGPGFIWVASYDQRGRGTLRLTAVDVSLLSPAVADAQPPRPADNQPVTSAGTNEAPAPFEPAAAQTTPVPAGPDAPTVTTEKTGPEIAFNDTRAQATVEKARFDAPAPDSGAQRAGIDAAVDRLKSVSKVAYGVVAGLIVALLAAVLLLSRRRNRASTNQTASRTANVAAANAGVAIPAVSASVAASRAAAPQPAASSIESGISNIAPSTFEDAIAAQAVANTAGNPTVVHGAGPLAPAGLEEQAAASIVPNLPEHSGAGGSEYLAPNDPVARLLELAKLRASGLLTESEFNQLKASIIASASRDSAAPSDQPPHAAL